MKLLELSLKIHCSFKNVGVLPLKGISTFDSEGSKFWNLEANKALFEFLNTHLNSEISIIEIDLHINNNTFGDLLLEELYRIIDYAPAYDSQTHVPNQISEALNEGENKL